MRGLSHLTRKGKLLLGLGVAVIVGALVVSLVLVRLRSADREDAVVAPPAAGDRLLQAVKVTMGNDGSTNQIGDTVVITRASTGQFDTYSSSYDPSKVVDQLPVRVLTSYRTAQSSGTDLAALNGYTGRVTIDLTVQNLTVKPQQVRYDAGGRSRSATAMVGAPLTIVASASLPGVDPATVVTESSDPAGKGDTTKGDTTNGVLGRSADQTTQVQWATILAPPQLSATATLRLVLDAKDFTVPTLDVGVQPGLVTDPSVGALVDAAFNPKNSEELALVSRTIEVVGDVNEVLTRASGQISKVRKTLDSTSQTLATKTVASLQADTKQIDSSLKQSDKNLDGLDKALESSLKSASSSTLQQLSSTVNQVDALLGDTSARAPSVTVTGSGCASKVKVPEDAGTVYGSLLQLTAQLNAYAKTTGDCKVELQGVIAKTIGPEHPANSDACKELASSVTCTLNRAQQTFADVEEAVRAGQEASNALDPAEDFTGSQQTVGALVTQLTTIRDATDTLLAEDPDTDPPNLNQISAKLDAAAAALEGAQASITEAVRAVHDTATDNQAEVAGMVAQNKEAADQLCDLIGDGTQPGAPTADQINEIRAYLVTESCPDVNGQVIDITPPPPYTEALSTRLGNQAAAWKTVADDTNTENVDSKFGQLLVADDADLLEALAAIKGVVADLGESKTSITAVNTAAKDALTNLNSLNAGLADLQVSYTTAKDQLDAALADAAEKASSTNLDSAIEQVSDQSAEKSRQLGEAFENSAKGLTSAAEALQESGKKAVNQQRTELANTEQQASRSLSTAMTGSLDQISGDISSATRDLGTTRTQLTRDLANILLDLGDPNVKGSGVIGTLSKGATAAGSADYQLALASDRTTAYGSVREQDVAGIMLRQAQAEAALQRQADLPAFVLDLPDSVQHRTVYTFHLAGGR